MSEPTQDLLDWLKRNWRQDTQKTKYLACSNRPACCWRVEWPQRKERER